jgi:hypothetical protein
MIELFYKILETQIIVFVIFYLLSYPGGFIGNLLEEGYGDYTDGLIRFVSLQAVLISATGWLIFMNT